eukprot:gene1434-1663_t
MAPIDYGFPDDMLDDGRSDKMDSPCSQPSPIFSEDGLVPDVMLLDSDFDIKYGVATHQGTRKHMEDRHKIKIGMDNNSNIALFGVFDGHGGDNRTGYSSKSSGSASSSGAGTSPCLYESPHWKKPSSLGPSQQNEVQSRSEHLQAALYSSFHMLDNRYHKKYRQKNESGTTCLVALLSTPPNSQPLLVVANAGDSRGVLCRSGKAIPLSFDHKPGNPKEKQRITNAGGKIEWDYNEKTWRVAGILSVSRGIGDIPLKKWVVCDPEFVVIPLKGVPRHGPSSASSSQQYYSTPLLYSSLGSSTFGSSPGVPFKSSPSSKMTSSPIRSPFSPRNLWRSRQHRHSSPYSPTDVPFMSDDDSVVPDLGVPPFSLDNQSARGSNLGGASASVKGVTKPRPKRLSQQYKTPTPSSSNIYIDQCEHIYNRKHSPNKNNLNMVTGDVDQYFVLATDGVWDVFTNQEMVEHINHLIEEIYTSRRITDWDATEVSKRVTMEASNREPTSKSEGYLMSEQFAKTPATFENQPSRQQIENEYMGMYETHQKYEFSYQKGFLMLSPDIRSIYNISTHNISIYTNQSCLGSKYHRMLLKVLGYDIVIINNLVNGFMVKARPSVLWCYKKELSFSKHKKKKIKMKERMKASGTASTNLEDPFDVFISTTNIRYTYYSESHKILGNTFGMVVLQDFEAITPNLLARTIETVEGGGLVIMLLKSMTSLRQLYTMSMDVHSRFRGDETSSSDVVCRFNERFLLSLGKCEQCLVMDDSLNILPISSHSRVIEPIDASTIVAQDAELKDFKQSVRDTEIAGALIDSTRSVDQAKAVLTFIDAISEKTLRSTVTLTAGRGRGKSAALGLAIAAAVAFGYSNIFVSSPSPENLVTLFNFVFKGFDALDYTEHVDYELVKSTNPEFHDAIIRVNIFRAHRQTIQYIAPSDHHKLGQAELVVIDEAAAIPLPFVKQLLGPYLVFLSSTINGYEGTGRSLSMKLIKQLREQSGTTSNATTQSTGRILREIQLVEPIRYAAHDPVEAWLNALLCLDASLVPASAAGCPHPSACQLFYVNRDTLFSYHKASEAFLQRLVALFVASHYKNSPNDLLLMSDSPDHHLFVLLGPMPEGATSLPDILCAVQVSLEGEIAKEAILNSIKKGYQASGDLIPWTLTQHFQDEDFPRLSGARVVRIATHPDYQKMGYGSKALDLLTQYYQGEIATINEDDSDEETEVSVAKPTAADPSTSQLQTELIMPKKNLPPLLFKLTERKPELLHYMGVSYGVTAQLYQFWSKAKYLPVYLRLTSNEITGEHTYFRKRFASLLGYEFRAFSSSLSLNILQDVSAANATQETLLTPDELDMMFSSYDLKRLESYSNNIVDFNVIIDLLPTIGRLYFAGKLNEVRGNISILQAAVLVAMALQHKTVDQLVAELGVQSNQVMSIFGQMMRRVFQALRAVKQRSIDNRLPQAKIAAPRTGQLQSFKGDVGDDSLIPLAEDMEDELEKGAQEVTDKMLAKEALMDDKDLSQYLIQGDEEEWNKALKSGKIPSSISIKAPKRKLDSDDEDEKKKNQKKTKPSGNKKFGNGGANKSPSGNKKFGGANKSRK